MKKKRIKAFRHEHLLLGRKDGIDYWLESPEWCCGWYWGFGIVQTFTNNRNPERSRDIESLSHFDCMFLKGPKNCYDMFKEFFDETPLSEDELWALLDYMKSAYALKESAELALNGYSYITGRAYSDVLKDEEEAKKINEIKLPFLFREMEKLLSPEE